ncbi:hypothetical protein ACONUD_00755 [Microbulbifer harenosus]|uniref:Helix-turn-helix domain-containing protein n=1 Tax=Microbulbifer harenosus TaxID=2576840 RepID=A0ABY2UMY5_9GAMM|nr:hypothetical protein [Microbulbifer harenosus]TLM79939.1 hypothetical protein FDY93_00750 [Microbulbifer harenosus]
MGASVDWLMHGGGPSKRFTAGQKQAQQNLRAIWQAKKKQLDLTQVKAAHLMDWNSPRSSASHLDGRIPLNTDVMLKFAELLNVPPEKIDTEFPYGAMANPPSKSVEDWPAARQETDIPRHIRDLFDAALNGKNSNA